MHRECVCMKQIKREVDSPQGGGSGGSLIGPQNAAQSKLVEFEGTYQRRLQYNPL